MNLIIALEEQNEREVVQNECFEAKRVMQLGREFRRTRWDYTRKTMA